MNKTKAFNHFHKLMKDQQKKLQETKNAAKRTSCLKSIEHFQKLLANIGRPK